MEVFHEQKNRTISAEKEIRTEKQVGNTHYVLIGCCNNQGKTVSEKVKNLIRLEARNVAADREEI